MSPPPPPARPLDGNDLQTIAKDGIIASILGGLAMSARLLLSTEPVSLGWAIRRVSAASIVAVLVNYTTKDYIANHSLQIAAVGATAYAAPECLDFLLRWIKAKGEAEVAKVVKKPNGKKPKAKRKR
jgi:hypothetical protein